MDPIHPITPGPPTISSANRPAVQSLERITRERDRPSKDAQERQRRRQQQEGEPERRRLRRRAGTTRTTSPTTADVPTLTCASKPVQSACLQELLRRAGNTTYRGFPLKFPCTLTIIRVGRHGVDSGPTNQTSSRR